MVELVINGELPTVVVDGEMTVDGQRMRFRTSDPAVTIARVVPQLPAGGLQSVEIIRPSLEAAYLTLTGRRYEQADQEVERAHAG